VRLPIEPAPSRSNVFPEISSQKQSSFSHTVDASLNGLMQTLSLSDLDVSGDLELDDSFLVLVRVSFI
jgi:hypothetical protein